MERCLFCGWARKGTDRSIRFFGIPKEPGLKRVMWLHAIGARKFSVTDRVCSFHFRQGRPSNDPSHEDFAPHLYLDGDAPPEIIQYLKNLAERRMEPDWFIEAQYKNVTDDNNSNCQLRKPAILQRKRIIKQDVSQNQASKSCEEDNAAPVETVAKEGSNKGKTAVTAIDPKRMKVHVLQRACAQSDNVKPAAEPVQLKRYRPVSQEETFQRC